MPTRFGGLEMFFSCSFSFLYPHLRPFHNVERWTLVSAHFGGLEVVRSLLAIARRAMVGPGCPLASAGLRCSFPPYFSLLHPRLRPFHDVEWWAFVPAHHGGLKAVWSFPAIAQCSMVGPRGALTSVGWKRCCTPLYSLGGLHCVVYWANERGIWSMVVLQMFYTSVVS